MIIKLRKIPIRILMEEALLRRLPFDHKKRADIILNLKRTKAGYRGEQNLDYYLTYLPEKDYYIFHDLRLAIQDKKVFQIDTLLLTPHMAVIIESKNFYGHLFFDQHSRQLIRTFEGQEEGFSNPLTQAKRQQIRFEEWLKYHQIKPFPVEFLVAIGYPGTIVKTNPGMHHIFQKVLHAEHIPDKIDELHRNNPKRHKTPYYMQKLCQLLLQDHTPLYPNVLNQYEIGPKEILQGVQCPKCLNLPILRQHSVWNCPQCHHKSKTTHEQAIHDYLLFHPTITNQECRDFLQISSRHLANRILISMDLPHKGTGKGRIYYRT